LCPLCNPDNYLNRDFTVFVLKYPAIFRGDKIYEWPLNSLDFNHKGH
jgi:hypothetical protein